MRLRSMSGATILVAALLLSLLPAGVQGQGSGTTVSSQIARLKELQQRRMLERAKSKWAKTKKRGVELARQRGAKAKKSGARIRPAPPLPVERLREGARRMGRSQTVPPSRVAALAPNVQVNDRIGEPVGSGQSEVSIGAFGNNLMAAWNDGQGFFSGGSTQGVATSTNGGATWTDRGTPPTSGTILSWASDPVVVVNEKTGAFYYCGLIDVAGARNGVGVVKGTFDGGGNFSWGTPRVVRSYPNGFNLLDKQWLAVDSLTGNLYVSYTNFFNSGQGTTDRIDFDRSTDDGVTWSASPTVLSATADQGRVQGSRPIVGPNGEVYVVWFAIGSPANSAFGRDFMRIRQAPVGGLTFGAHVTADSLFSNFGNGAPGFNRGIGVTFPAIAVDRTTGPRRGRVYVSWNESLDFYDDELGTTTNKSEAEANDGSGQATPFTVNQVVRGTLAHPADVDWFQFTGQRAQTVIIYADSLATNPSFGFDLVCGDGSTFLGFSESGQGPGSQGLIVFTLPADGTYYLIVASLNGAPGPYRIQTGFANSNPARGRDHRDVFVTHSDNGILWSGAVRVNEDAGYFDDWLPEVAVGSNGKPYVAWYDWRDAPVGFCGGLSHVYLARSEDGGTTWTTGSPVTDQPTQWSQIASNIAPNQGDYIGLFGAGGKIYAAWGDGRLGDPDVFAAVIDEQYTATLLALAGVQATPDRVHLTWYATDPNLMATVYRRRQGDPWIPLRLLSPDGTGLVRFEDHDVRPGERYQYRLGVRFGDDEHFFGEVWVEVPSPFTRLAIRGVRPNPTPGDIWVSFALPNGDPARLELLDVAGRRVAEREVGSFGAGAHQVRLTEGPSLGPGVYVVRLSQGGSSVTERVSVVR
jgi:hypothetical protein